MFKDFKRVQKVYERSKSELESQRKVNNDLRNQLNQIQTNTELKYQHYDEIMDIYGHKEAVSELTELEELDLFYDFDYEKYPFTIRNLVLKFWLNFNIHLFAKVYIFNLDRVLLKKLFPTMNI